MHSTGEKPGIGTYKCTKSGTTVRLDDHDDTLPPCPKCANTTFTKVGYPAIPFRLQVAKRNQIFQARPYFPFIP
jgi:hypothetical protein